MRVYAIGDIHGQLEMLRGAHARIAADRERTGDDTAQVVHLGDLCDRGPDSRGVIQFLLDGLGAGAPWRLVRGNHDRMFMDFLRPPDAPPSGFEPAIPWLDGRLGGRDTLRSYGIRADGAQEPALLRAAARAQVSEAHRQLLEATELIIELPHLILVHAGIRPGVPIAAQIERDLIWIREPFLSDARDHGKLVVHGHTPVEVPMHCGNRVDLDTGAGYFRPLTVAVFEGRDAWVLTDEGRQPLTPY